MRYYTEIKTNIQHNYMSGDCMVFHATLRCYGSVTDVSSELVFPFKNAIISLMDQYGWNQNANNTEPPRPAHTGRSAAFETAALSFGILGLFTASCGVGMFFGALAVIFGLLSKGGADTLSPKGKAGTYIGIAAIVVTGLIFVFSFVIMIRMFGGIDGFLAQYNDLYNAMQSDDPAELMEVYSRFYGGYGY